MDESMIPPEELDYGIRVSNFPNVGPEYAGYCRELGELRPDGTILDVGCGFGPLAAALTEYLTPAGRYEGFDIVSVGVEWGRTRITARFANFRFTWLDVYNDTYCRNGRLDPVSLRFPYPDSCFDLVHLRSVFTHMLPSEIDNYMGQITRVMKPDGRCLISYFLLNEESLGQVDRGCSHVEFPHRHGVYWRTSRPPQGSSIAYEEDYIRGLYHKHRLRILDPVHYGSWCGREQFLSSQDIVLAVKEESKGVPAAFARAD